MKFTDAFILLQIYKEIYKEYLIYDINKNISKVNLKNVKGEIQEHIGNGKFGIVAATLCHKVGLKVKNLDNPNLNFNNLTEQDYQSESFMIDEV